MFGIDEFTSIINQPNSAILSVGAIVQNQLKDGEIVVGSTMKLTLAATIEQLMVLQVRNSFKLFGNISNNPYAWSFNTMQSPKRVIVTGASRGIGRAWSIGFGLGA
ncbi:MAG: hypothetical protein CM15mP59_3470 [Flavobacteriaceae bacterium]|nr:MAG: hypothetical protein CM15mP59_3470 [Flavobacteriaceae bacterium]